MKKKEILGFCRADTVNPHTKKGYCKGWYPMTTGKKVKVSKTLKAVKSHPIQGMMQGNIVHIQIPLKKALNREYGYSCDFKAKFSLESNVWKWFSQHEKKVFSLNEQDEGMASGKPTYVAGELVKKNKGLWSFLFKGPNLNDREGIRLIPWEWNHLNDVLDTAKLGIPKKGKKKKNKQVSTLNKDDVYKSLSFPDSTEEELFLVKYLGLEFTYANTKLKVTGTDSIGKTITVMRTDTPNSDFITLYMIPVLQSALDTALKAKDFTERLQIISVYKSLIGHKFQDPYSKGHTFEVLDILEWDENTHAPGLLLQCDTNVGTSKWWVTYEVKKVLGIEANPDYPAPGTHAPIKIDWRKEVHVTQNEDQLSS